MLRDEHREVSTKGANNSVGQGCDSMQEVCSVWIICGVFSQGTIYKEVGSIGTPQWITRPPGQ